VPLFTIHVWKKRKSIRYGKHLQTKEQILQRIINWEVMRIMLRGKNKYIRGLIGKI
jgi:hypothetical protein